MSEKDIVFWTFIVTVVGVIFALGGIAVAVWTLRETTHITKAQFLISMRNLLSKYDDVHAKLRPGGEWTDSPSEGPRDALEWGRLEIYMGTFEYCETLIRNGFLDKKEFCKAYGYRLKNIVANPIILRAKLIELGEYWVDFGDICKRCGIELPPDACVPKPGSR